MPKVVVPKVVVPKVVVPIKEEILRTAERRRDIGLREDIADYLGELVVLGFEYRLQQLYEQFEAGEISLAYFAQEMGLSMRDLYEVLEQRSLPTSNIELPLAV
jgi:hypothetical protein